MNLIFDVHLGSKTKYDMPLIEREAVRAIILNDGKILVNLSSRGDCKLPGGGVEEGESQIAALKREVLEETGYNCVSILGPVGKVFERKVSRLEEGFAFEMLSSYYLCSVSDLHSETALSPSEESLGFKPGWMSLETIIDLNETYMGSDLEKGLWTSRETMIFKIIRESIDQLTGLMND